MARANHPGALKELLVRYLGAQTTRRVFSHSGSKSTYAADEPATAELITRAEQALAGALAAPQHAC
ncbi:hypothetical protein HORIV_30410 [Vreelandella olivaria]|uniref:Uncharacterized protein n=1 Tax=Vreelandella olivaria TaxID=390919 RepID=A0ABM7GJ76_9GAMM|nr:hypothetical protein HORIV_30410 [Halomonas olivaria]